MGDFFSKPDSGSSGGNKKWGGGSGEKKPFITYAAGWFKVGKGDKPYIAFVSSKDDFKAFLDYAGVEYNPETLPEKLPFMAFMNDNKRDGKSDPDIYLFPVKEG